MLKGIYIISEDSGFFRVNVDIHELCFRGVHELSPSFSAAISRSGRKFWTSWIELDIRIVIKIKISHCHCWETTTLTREDGEAIIRRHAIPEEVAKDNDEKKRCKIISLRNPNWSFKEVRETVRSLYPGLGGDMKHSYSFDERIWDVLKTNEFEK